MFEPGANQRPVYVHYYDLRFFSIMFGYALKRSVLKLLYEQNLKTKAKMR